MVAVILVVHIFFAIALIATILIQKSEGGALGIGGGGMSGFMTGRSTANLLTRTTAGLAVLFFLTSIVLAILAGHGRAARSVVDENSLPSGPIPTAPAKPGLAPGTAPAKSAAPQAPATPSAPLAK
ncbi:MAG TPA: preprotein translocase subunit SecG [Stellaceae bacterium]|jgi:preprotein translocase subunit SecG|nr:preprotein translocase subunit SecG [Stellaceae bacterium]